MNRKVPMKCADGKGKDVVREFDSIHAQNLLRLQSKRVKKCWSLVPKTGFTFKDNELAYNDKGSNK